MADRNDTVSSEQTIAGPLTLSITFTFDEQWKFGPANKLNSFPPGGGLGLHEIEIKPVHLKGLTSAEIVLIEQQRADDMALIAQAIAAASVQFSGALKVVKG